MEQKVYNINTRLSVLPHMAKGVLKKIGVIDTCFYKDSFSLSAYDLVGLTKYCLENIDLLDERRRKTILDCIGKQFVTLKEATSEEDTVCDDEYLEDEGSYDPDTSSKGKDFLHMLASLCNGGLDVPCEQSKSESSFEKEESVSKSITDRVVAILREKGSDALTVNLPRPIRLKDPVLGDLNYIANIYVDSSDASKANIVDYITSAGLADSVEDAVNMVLSYRILLNTGYCTNPKYVVPTSEFTDNFFTITRVDKGGFTGIGVHLVEK